MITFQEVTKAFGPDDFALKEVSFVVEPGELVFITGASGSGKTTLMRLLTKEMTPTEGEIYFAETALSTVGSGKVHEHRRRIGVVFQDYRLLPELNVWENVALPLFVAGKSDAEVEERVTDLLKLVNLTHKADLFPSQLSGGEAQRISIARALASGPEVIFADEPTGNLDQETGQHIADLLIKINELGTTVLFATHDHRFLEAYPQHHRLHLEGGALIIDTATAKSKAPQTTRDTKHSSSPKKESKKTQDVNQEAVTEVDAEAELSPAPKKPGIWQRLFGKKTDPANSISLLHEEDSDDTDQNHTQDQDAEDVEEITADSSHETPHKSSKSAPAKSDSDKPPKPKHKKSKSTTTSKKQTTEDNSSTQEKLSVVTEDLDS